MTALDRLLQLQQQGLSEPQIINSLQQEGFSMKDIDDSMNQAKIKSAVSQEPEQMNQGYQESQQYNPNTPQNNISGEYAPQNPAEQTYQAPQEYQDYQQYPVDATQQNYGGYYAQEPVQNNTETITDIAEQVMEEKTQSLSKKIDALNQSKNSLQREIEEIKEKVKRIEGSLDSIQKAIIGKIGEFGESTKMVQKDLENIHGTMSKMMNPLIDNYNELKKLNSNK